MCAWRLGLSTPETGVRSFVLSPPLQGPTDDGEDADGRCSRWVDIFRLLCTLAIIMSTRVVAGPGNTEGGGSLTVYFLRVGLRQCGGGRQSHSVCTMYSPRRSPSGEIRNARRTQQTEHRFSSHSLCSPGGGGRARFAVAVAVAVAVLSQGAHRQIISPCTLDICMHAYVLGGRVFGVHPSQA